MSDQPNYNYSAPGVGGFNNMGPQNIGNYPTQGQVMQGQSYQNVDPNINTQIQMQQMPVQNYPMQQMPVQNYQMQQMGQNPQYNQMGQPSYNPQVVHNFNQIGGNVIVQSENLYPKISIGAAITILVINIFFPGVGTVIMGCMSNNSCTWICIGLCQLLLAFIIVGWVWAIITGVLALDFAQKCSSSEIIVLPMRIGI